MAEMKGSLEWRGGYAKAATGGLGGPIVFAEDVDELFAYLKDDNPRKVVLRPYTNYDFRGKTLRCGSNKTLIGDVGSSIIRGEFRIQGEKNVIVYHVRFRDPHGDCLVSRDSDLVHVTWCTFDQGTVGTNKHGGKADGAFDVVGWAGRHTFAFNRVLRFHKVHLFGWSREQSADMRITCYRNWYKGNRRIPQCNGGYIHMRNNVVDWYDACAASYDKAHVWYDTCRIDSRKKKSPCGEYKRSGKPNGYLAFSGCTYVNCKYAEYKKDRAKLAKREFEDLTRTKNWSRIKKEAGMKYAKATRTVQ